MKNVKEEKLSIEESVKGLTLDQARFDLISAAFELVDTRIVTVLKGRLSRKQRDLLSEALYYVQKCRTKVFPKDD